MAFVAGAAGRAVAGRAAGGAAARGTASKAASKGASKAAGSGSAFGTAARAKGDPQLAKELADFNAVDDAPAAPSSPAEPAAPAPAPQAPASSSSSAGTRAKKWATTDNRGTPDGYRQAAKYASPTVALNAGGGALLGLAAYMVGLTYLRSGRDGVKALLRAKFLNQTSAPAAGSTT